MFRCCVSSLCRSGFVVPGLLAKGASQKSQRTVTFYRASALSAKLADTHWIRFQTALLSFAAYYLLKQHSPAVAECRKKMEQVITIDTSTLLLEADDLFNQNKFAEILDVLKNSQDSDNAEILWRICRAIYNEAKTDKSNKRKENIRRAFQFAKRAMEVDDKNFAVQKWYALLLDENAALDGIKARLNESLKFKEHMILATELNPNDGTSLYILGAWCFAVAELPWYQRKIAAALFAAPPTSSYEEALEYFLRAEEVEPNFYSRNLLMLGKTYLRLGDPVKARAYLEQTIARPARTDEDHQDKKEAQELLKTIKP